MKYSLQCKYSMINQVFLFVIKSLEKNYTFQWQVPNVDKPIWFLTNNNIIFKSELVNDLVQFSVVSSDQDINAQLVRTATTPILTFETEKQNIQIIYDFDQNPTYNKKIVALILSKVIQACNGGFLQTNEQYKELQGNIQKLLIDLNLIKVENNQTQVKKVIKRSNKKEVPEYDEFVTDDSRFIEMIKEKGLLEKEGKRIR